jgi:hypothetical protein
MHLNNNKKLQVVSKIWNITIIDLLLVIICFFVLSYAKNIQTNIKAKKIPIIIEQKDNLKNTKDLERDSDKKFIYNYLKSVVHIKGKIHFYEKNNSVLIVYNEQITPEDFIESLREYLHKYSSNQIRISIFYDIMKIKNDEVMQQKIINKLMIARNLLNILAKKTNNDNIVTMVDSSAEDAPKTAENIIIAIEIL